MFFVISRKGVNTAVHCVCLLRTQGVELSHETHQCYMTSWKRGWNWQSLQSHAECWGDCLSGNGWNAAQIKIKHLKVITALMTWLLAALLSWLCASFQRNTRWLVLLTYSSVRPPKHTCTQWEHQYKQHTVTFTAKHAASTPKHTPLPDSPIWAH